MDEEIFDAWDKLHIAIQRVLVSQPSEMTEAAEELDIQKRNFEGLMRKKALNTA